MILVKSRKAGERVMESVRRFVTRKLRLKVNEAKSKVAPSRECRLLVIGGKGQLRISKESKARMTDRLKELTRRNRGRKFGAIIGDIHLYLRGWLNYYRLASAKTWNASEFMGMLKRWVPDFGVCSREYPSIIT